MWYLCKLYSACTLKQNCVIIIKIRIILKCNFLKQIPAMSFKSVFFLLNAKCWDVCSLLKKKWFPGKLKHLIKLLPELQYK